MNLVNELQKIAQANHESQLKEAEEILNSVKQNLQEEHNADTDMLKFFGTNNVVVEQKRRVSDIKKYIDEAHVTEADIKKICLGYNLRFLNAFYYKKEIPITALSDLRKFIAERGFSEYAVRGNLMIIAPKEHFVLGPRPQKDPILLYKLNDAYVVISRWGNDFSSRRRLYAFFAKYRDLTPQAIVLTVVTIIFFFTKEPLAFVGLFAMLIPGLIISAEMTTIRDSWDKNWE